MSERAASMAEQHSGRAFCVSLVLAALLHAAVVSAWQVMPSPLVEDIEVKSLRVKLGNALSGQERAMIASATMPKPNAAPIEASINDMFAPLKPAVEAERDVSTRVAKGSANATPQESSQFLRLPNADGSGAQVAKHYVRKREQVQPQTQVAGQVLGNTEMPSEQIIARYTQTIALWMDKFKVYPEEARKAGMQGRGIVRVRIDRRGNIHYRILTQRTPYPILDKAILDMARRANPVPPVPEDYPAKEAFLEFMIPVTFKLE